MNLSRYPGTVSGNPSSEAPRQNVAVTCSGCGVQTTVPFTPTPGRPVYCRECFAKKGGSAGTRPMGGGGGGRPSPFGPRIKDEKSMQRKRMVAQGRKAHFIYDTIDVLSKGKMLEENRRVFAEMLFTRGARISTQAAYDFLEEKVVDKTIEDSEAVRLGALVDKYSFWR